MKLLKVDPPSLLPTCTVVDVKSKLILITKVLFLIWKIFSGHQFSLSMTLQWKICLRFISHLRLYMSVIGKEGQFLGVLWYPIGIHIPVGRWFLLQMYPVWDTFLQVDIQIKKGENCVKRGSYKRNLKKYNKFRKFWLHDFKIHRVKRKIFNF